MNVQCWRARSVGEVSEACHNERIRHELSVPSAESSYGVRGGFEREKSYHLGRGMIVSATREMLARATSDVEKSSELKVKIRNSHCLSAPAEALVGNFQRAVAQSDHHWTRGGGGGVCLPVISQSCEATCGSHERESAMRSSVSACQEILELISLMLSSQKSRTNVVSAVAIRLTCKSLSFIPLEVKDSNLFLAL